MRSLRAVMLWVKFRMPQSSVGCNCQTKTKRTVRKCFREGLWVCLGLSIMKLMSGFSRALQFSPQTLSHPQLWQFPLIQMEYQLKGSQEETPPRTGWQHPQQPYSTYRETIGLVVSPLPTKPEHWKPILHFRNKWTDLEQGSAQEQKLWKEVGIGFWKVKMLNTYFWAIPISEQSVTNQPGFWEIQGLTLSLRKCLN